MNNLYIAITTLLFVVLLFSSGCSEPIALPEYAIKSVQSISYVDELDLGYYAFAYAEGYNIYIKNYNSNDKFLLFISGLTEEGVIRHETGHVYDYFMFMSHSRVWSDYNMERFGHVDFWGYSRRERFAEDVRKLNKKNKLYRYLGGK